MFHVELSAYLEQGGHVLGICGGYQMLGSVVEDPQGLEGAPGLSRGLDFLPVKTRLKAPKTTTISDFEWEGVKGNGYEIHMGVTEMTGGSPLINIFSRNQEGCRDTDGCIRSDHRVCGTYIHGFFDYPDIADKWLGKIGIDTKSFKQRAPHHLKKDKDYDLLKVHFESHVDISSFY